MLYKKLRTSCNSKIVHTCALVSRNDSTIFYKTHTHVTDTETHHGQLDPSLPSQLGPRNQDQLWRSTLSPLLCMKLLLPLLLLLIIYYKTWLEVLSHCSTMQKKTKN